MEVLPAEDCPSHHQQDLEPAEDCPSHHQQDLEVSVRNIADNCDICISTNKGQTNENQFPASLEIDMTNAKSEQKKKAFELAESVNSGEDTSDESNDEDMQQFLSLMNKAERKNDKKVSNVQIINLGSSRKPGSDWRDAEMEDHDSDSTTDDEDDSAETRRFLSLMEKNKRKEQERNMVNIRWEGGKVMGLPSSVKVTRIPASEEAVRRHQEDLVRRRRDHLEAIRREGRATPSTSGKRKFEERMTLSEAKAEDFTDTKDYVDFIQAKLKNVNIKIIK